MDGPMRRLFLNLAILVAVQIVVTGSGCGRAVPTPGYPEEAEAAEFGGLRLSRTVNHPQLSAALDLVEAEQGLPEQLDAAWRAAGSTEHPERLPALLADPGSERARRDLEATAAWFSPQGLRIGPINQDLAAAIAHRWAPAAEQARPLWTADRVPYPNRTVQGYLEDLAWVDTVRMTARAELLLAWQATRAGELDKAGRGIAQALEIARTLGHVPSVTTRRVAAEIRQETFLVVDQWVKVPQLPREDLQRVADTLGRTLNDWPDDRQTWQGDRARGLHFYEMIRGGRFVSLLSDEELLDLTESKHLAPFRRAVERGLNADQQFYLEQMALVIAATERPYYQRAAVLEDVAVRVDALMDTADDPLIARNFLLLDIQLQQAQSAADLARTLAWHLALQAALGHEIKPVTNPLTGEPLAVTQEESRVLIPERQVTPTSSRIIVPRPTGEGE
jgi:hypothetical protein